MINIFIGMFIAVLIGVGFLTPIVEQVNTAAVTNGALYNSSTWAATTLKMVPGFYALVILGVVVGGLFAVFRQAGVQ